MKTFIQITLFIIFCVCIVQPAHSQRLLRKLQDKVQDKVEEKLEDRAEKKVDKTIDNQLDKLEESLEKNEDGSKDASGESNNDSQRQERMQNILKGIGVSGETVPFADNYNFNHLIQMQIESYDKKGKKESEGEFKIGRASCRERV